MTFKEIEEIVQNTSNKKYLIKTKDGRKYYKRLWKAQNGKVAMMFNGAKCYGSYLEYWDIENWESIREVKKRKTDMVKLVTKRATDAVRMLNESGLWEDIRKCIEYFLANPQIIKEFCDDMEKDPHRNFYQQLGEGGKYEWCNCNQIFYSFYAKRCWKSVAYHKWYNDKERVIKAIKEKTSFRSKWKNGYDCSVDVENVNGKSRAWYSEEFVGCGNGHYYLLFDATHAIFYEDD